LVNNSNTYESLEYVDDDEYVDEEDNEDTEEESQASDYEVEEEDDDLNSSNASYGQSNFSIGEAQEMVDYWRSKKNGKKRAWSTMCNKFKKLKSYGSSKILYKLDQRLKQKGKNYDKIRDISDYCIHKFKLARQDNLAIHDIDLQTWAIERANELGFDFKASRSWVNTLKRDNRISSRKITKIVSKKYRQELNQTLTNASNFLIHTNEQTKYIDHSFIINTDQSGFNLEIPPTRTLSHTGEKTTIAAVNSVNSTTHSYTVQYSSTKAGTLLPKVFICLKEAKKVFVL